jgi:CRP-like cAMP-binding protein
MEGAVQLDPSAFVADPDLVQILQTRSAPVSCDLDRVLFRQGEDLEGLYLLHSGAMTLSTISLGKHILVSFQTTAGSLVGLRAVLDNEASTVTAVAHRGARLSFIHRSAFTAVVRSDSLLMLKILRALAREMTASRRAILGQNCVGAEGGERNSDESISIYNPKAGRRDPGTFAVD